MSDTPEQPAPQAHAPKHDAPARELLIVEDDDAFARTLGRSFERRGYRGAGERPGRHA